MSFVFRPTPCTQNFMTGGASLFAFPTGSDTRHGEWTRSKSERTPEKMKGEGIVTRLIQISRLAAFVALVNSVDLTPESYV
jgi:hypothetical protein